MRIDDEDRDGEECGGDLPRLDFDADCDAGSDAGLGGVRLEAAAASREPAAERFSRRGWPFFRSSRRSLDKSIASGDRRSSMRLWLGKRPWNIRLDAAFQANSHAVGRPLVGELFRRS